MPNDAKSDLSVSASESLKVGDVGSPSQPLHGLVAVLDALGASNYSKEEADEFLDSRDLVWEATKSLSGNSLNRFESKRLHQFMFNDTVIVAYLLDKLAIESIPDVEVFCHILRIFETLSVRLNLLFRGSLAVGDFYRVSSKDSIIMGPAVADAAAWYGLADWIGINATPHATMFIDSLLQGQAKGALDHVLVDYRVPLKDKRRLKLKVVNWPKGFYVKGLAPAVDGATAKAQLLTILSKQRVPRDTESKYFNTIRFFDYIERKQRLNERFGASPSAAAPEDSDDSI